MAAIDDQILSISGVISSNIDHLGHDRALLSQNVLSQLRNLVEAVTLRLRMGDGTAEFAYAKVGDAIDWVGSEPKARSFLRRFHDRLQMSASHYTLERDASERLMLSYFEYLVRIKQLVQDEFGYEILPNLAQFPFDNDPTLRVYHAKIAERIEAVRGRPAQVSGVRYYISKVRPFFIRGRIYYEVTFSNVSDRWTKIDRIIAFTHIDVSNYYAAELTLVEDSIDVVGKKMPITIIIGWQVAIRPCEVNNFSKIFGVTTRIGTTSLEYRRLMDVLTVTGMNLVTLIDMSAHRYNAIRESVTEDIPSPVLFPVLDRVRELSERRQPGSNVARYLLLRMNNRIIKLQYDGKPCGFLSNLRLKWSCGPFDTMPFCTSPTGHNARFSDLLESISPVGRSHEMLGHRVKTNVERNGVLYTPEAELEELGDLDDLVEKYNGSLRPTHGGRKLTRAMKHVVMAEYEDGAAEIVEHLQMLGAEGVGGYPAAVDRWLGETRLDIDDPTKRDALRSLFANSQVAFVYGAAGTGKSTLVDYVANYFGNRRQLFLAQTNPAKDNLERKVHSQNGEFRTIASHINRQDTQGEYDLVVIDECSIVSNADLSKVLNRTQFKLLLLVGDVYQIEAIRFGNWFTMARSFLPPRTVFELATPYRTKESSLLDLWTRVRQRVDGVEEVIAQHGYSAVLDESLFQPAAENEIILCLNYDGLYGINNVNRFLQGGNPGKAVTIGVNTYKVGDPILFTDVDRFRPVIFNNLKGRIVKIEQMVDHVRFDVWVDSAVTEFDVDGLELRYVGESTVQFDVYPRGSTDEDDEPLNSAVPFQIAYAVSIHKAQGLEFDSVKLVITDANEDDFSHNIFYTAITRARRRLKIFWTPATQAIILDRMREVSTHTKDVKLLSNRRALTPHR